MVALFVDFHRIDKNNALFCITKIFTEINIIVSVFLNMKLNILPNGKFC